MKDLKNKVAYITGGSKGIGFGVAKKLVESGMKVAISGRTLQTVQKAAAELGDENQVIGVASDVSKLRDEEEAVKKILNKWGHIDLVLANAGVGNFAPIDEMSETEWHQMINITRSLPM